MLSAGAGQGADPMANPLRSGRKSFDVSVLVLAAVLAGRAAAQAAPDEVGEMFVGVYALAEYAPHGDEPTGRIWYHANGQMSAMLYPPGREPLPGGASAEQFRESMRGVVAYFGTYTIDVEAGTVTHHVAGASNPAGVGDDFVRWYRFEDGNLRLSLNPDFDGTLLWQRLP